MNHDEVIAGTVNGKLLQGATFHALGVGSLYGGNLSTQSTYLPTYLPGGVAKAVGQTIPITLWYCTIHKILT